MHRIVVLPDFGRLLVATDLQGNVGDFLRIEKIFEDTLAEDASTILVVTGDLVHGPELDEAEWPDYLGTYYRGDSKTLLERAAALQQRHPGQVHYLLGNHEHAHVGGPVVSKFFPDEANRLEELFGPNETALMRNWLAAWPFLAIAPHAGLCMLHAAPHARIESAEEIESLPLDGFFELPIDETSTGCGLGSLLWARTTSTERANDFLRALDPSLRVAVYGHDVARAGYAVDREPLLCLSTSFGCYDGDKLYLDWNLSERAESAADVARRGLVPLHPDAPPVYRRTR